MAHATWSQKARRCRPFQAGSSCSGARPQTLKRRNVSYWVFYAHNISVAKLWASSSSCCVVLITSITNRRWTTCDKPPPSTTCQSPLRSILKDRKYVPEWWPMSVELFHPYHVERRTYTLDSVENLTSFSALTSLVGRQEGIRSLKKSCFSNSPKVSKVWTLKTFRVPA